MSARDGYEDRVWRNIERFTRKGDVLELSQVDHSEDSHVCELCDYNGIRWLHRLRNLRTGQSLIVGSRCIVNCKPIYERKRKEALTIRATEELSPVASKINKNAPGTIASTPPVIAPPCDDAAGELGWEDEYDEDDEDLEEDLDDVDVNEEAPEGLGADEIDWEDTGTLADDDSQ